MIVQAVEEVVASRKLGLTPAVTEVAAPSNPDLAPAVTEVTTPGKLDLDLDIKGRVGTLELELRLDRLGRQQHTLWGWHPLTLANDGRFSCLKLLSITSPLHPSTSISTLLGALACLKGLDGLALSGVTGHDVLADTLPLAPQLSRLYLSAGPNSRWCLNPSGVEWIAKTFPRLEVLGLCPDQDGPHFYSYAELVSIWNRQLVIILTIHYREPGYTTSRLSLARPENSDISPLGLRPSLSIEYPWYHLSTV